MAKKRPDPERIDQDNPEWTEEDFARARPAREVLPELLGNEAAAGLLRPRGRPKAEVTKERITIRLSRDVVDRFRATGEGWQTRMDAALKEYIETHQL